MTEAEAKDICTWEYPNEYSIYNIGGWTNAVNKKMAITLSQERKSQFRVVLSNNEILGYFRYKEEKNKIILGLGMHPKKCGKGLGKDFLKFILNSNELKDKLIEIKVRKFNKRAIKCYESVGFKIISLEDDIFIIMQNKNI